MRTRFGVQLLAISIYAFALGFLWNTLHPLVLPYLIARFEPGFKNTFLGLISAAGLVVATIVQPLAGGLSDRSRLRWGRRRPYILAGTLGDMVALAMIALAGSYGVLFAGYCLLQLTSNVAHGPHQGLIPDLMPENKRGLASGFKSMVELLALVIGSAVIGGLLGQDRPGLAIAVLAAVVFVSMLLTLALVKEKRPAGDAQEAAIAPLSLAGVVGALRGHRDFAWYIVSRFLILSGLAAVRTFAQNYIQDVLHADNPAALTGQLMTVLGVAVLVVVLPAGYLCDRFGNKPLNILAAVIGAAGTALMLRTTSFNDLVLYGCIVGVGVGIFMSANWAMAMDLIPAAEAALFLGLTNLATAGSGVGAALLGPLIDVLNRSLGPGQGYRALFGVAALMWLAGVLILARIPVRQRRGGAEAQ